MDKTPNKPGKLSWAFYAAAGLLLTLPYGLSAQDAATPAPAAAPAVAPAAEEEKIEELQEVVVTGSRMTGAEVEGTLSVTPITTDIIATSGSVSIGDVLKKKLPQYGGGTGVINESYGNGGSGASSISLRGLPEDATLLLVNGYRLASGDLNMIPDAAIQSVDILNDGAGAVYGSDAVAGVVNVKLYETFKGVRLDAYYGNTFDKDISPTKFSILAGDSTEKTDFVISADYSTANGMFSPDRNFSNVVATSGTSNPARFNPALPDNLAAENKTINDLISSIAEDPNLSEEERSAQIKAQQNKLWKSVPWAVNGATAGNGLTSAADLPANFDPTVFYTEEMNVPSDPNDPASAKVYSPTHLNKGLPAGSKVLYGNVGAAVPRFPYYLYTTLLRPYERYSGYGSVNHKIFNKNLEVFANFSYANNQSELQLAPTPVPAYTLPASNGWVTSVLGANGAESPSYSANYRFVEIGPRLYYTEFDEYRFVGGAKGQIAETTWNWKLTGMYDASSQSEVQTGGLNTVALDSLVAGTTADGATWNPFAVGWNHASNAANPGAVALNPSYGSLATYGILNNSYDIQLVDLNVGGSVVDLPGGNLQVSAGVESRKESTDQVPDYGLANGLLGGLNQYAYYEGKREVQSVFGEVLVPIFGQDFTAPALSSLSVSIAGRYEDYDDVGSTGFKPRYAMRWQPMGKQLTLRGSYAEGFSAPLIEDLIPTSEQDFQELVNPLTGVQEQPSDGVITISNPNLKPTDSQNILVGAVYSPDYIKNLSLGLDYYRIEQSGIPYESAQYIVDQWYAAGPNNPNNPFDADAPVSVVNPTGAQVELSSDGSGALQQVRNVGPINSGDRLTDGLDAYVDYTLDFGSVGSLNTLVRGTYVMTFEQENFPGAGTVDYLGYYWDSGAALGNYGFPEYRFNWDVTYRVASVAVTLAWNYVNGYDEAIDVDASGNPVYRTVEAWQTFDIQASYTLNIFGETVFAVGVNNFLDEQPPYVENSFENYFDRAVADPRGAFYYVRLTQTF